MDYITHLKEFLGNAVSDDEARLIGRVVIAGHVRQLKVAIAQQLWQARSKSASGDQAGGAGCLAQARSLKREYEDSLDQYAQLDPESVTRVVTSSGQETREPPNGRGPHLRLLTPEVAG